MTIIMVFFAYTVPRQWSKIMQRERDAETIHAMKQYARAIEKFRAKNGGYPVSLQQLREARTPRMIRGSGPILDPLTGEDDWIIVPAGIMRRPGINGPPGVPPPAAAPPTASQPPTSSQPPAPGTAGQTIGPIGGVRPNKSGPSFLTVNGADTYEQWMYTAGDLQLEIEGRRQALMTK
ncbi:MAG: hypothetical protein JJE51_00110 [Thermoanaerobaculia bacterium]|nr:hypothetical protein [Thermoanaerobaculia bacterium]